MDGISGAAAVVGLVQAASQVTTAITRYVSSVKGAESSSAKLLEQIKLITAAENTIEKVLRNSPPSSREPQLQDLVDGWFRADAFPTKCKQELERLSRWLERQAEDRKRNKWGKMIVWPVREDKIQATIRTFETYMPYFHYIISIESLSLIQGIATRNRDHEVDLAKLKILRWLDGFDCTDKHENIREQRQTTTGEWLFKEKLYIELREHSRKFLWLHGKAGAGKSVLASAVIDDLTSGLSNDEMLAYFYCDFRNPRCTSTAEVLRSLAKQLLFKSRNDWLPSIPDLTRREQQGSGPPTSLSTLSDLLKRATELHTRPIIVIDALDECEDSQKLLGELVKLFHGNCRLFVTSRTLHMIEETLATLPSISLEERVEEVRNDICRHIEAELESRSRLKILGHGFKGYVKDTLMRKADGMFRWVQCQLDRLNECYSLGDLLEVLHTLPDTLYETYDRMLRAIDKKPFGTSIACKALTWLVTALEPLALSQLVEAISISYDKLDFDANIAPMHESAILDVLGSLVAVSHDNVVTLAHYSVKEYLTSDTVAHSIYFIHRQSASLELATTSIFSLMFFSDQTEIDSEDKKSYLHSYADRCGFRHLADCPPSHNQFLVKHLLTLQNHISTYQLAYERYVWDNSWMLVTPQLALHIIIQFGHPDLLRHYLDCYSVHVTEEDNPLVSAALQKDVHRIQLLLGKGLDVNREGPAYDCVMTHRCMSRITPLIAAAHNYIRGNQEGLVKLLLENGCIVPRDAIHSVLSCKMGMPCTPAVVRILLERGADPRWSTAGNSCLHLALRPTLFGCNCIEVAQILIEAGCDLTALDDSGRSPLRLIIELRSTELLGWMLQHGFKLPPNAILYPLLAVRHTLDSGQELLSMLEFLIANGAIAGAQALGGYNSLHILSFSMRRLSVDLTERIVRLLVQHGCDINSREDGETTPLHLAITSRGHSLSLLKLFLIQGAELPLDIVNYVAESPRLELDQTEGKIAVLTFLVKELGASCQSRTIYGDNAIHCLLQCCNSGSIPDSKYIWDAISFLVENGCDLHAIALSGATPLQLAIEGGHFSIAQSIMERITAPFSSDDTIPHHGDSRGNGILHRLCNGSIHRDDQFVVKVKLLREAGYNFTRDINRPNHKGFTPLCKALMGGAAMYDPMIVSRLLDLGASFYHVNYLHLESLEWASSLPWYHDAAGTHGRCLSRSKCTSGQVVLAHNLLQAVHGTRISSSLTRSILDMAEYWACMKFTRKGVRYTVTHSTEQFVLPRVSGSTERWIPRRVVFACRGGVPVSGDQEDDHHRIDVWITRTDAAFAVPIFLHVIRDPLLPVRTEFDVWDEFLPAKQVNGGQRLMVDELTPGDTLDVEFSVINDDEAFTPEFFQIEIYYALKSAPGMTSGDL